MALLRDDRRLVYGGGGLLEYWNELVVVPRTCEHCLQHPAVYYDCSWWPAGYYCRPCIDAGHVEERERLALLNGKTCT